LILTFHGSPRYTHEDVRHVHESPASMVMPLVILAVFSFVAGYIGIPPALGGHNQIEAFLGAGPHEPAEDHGAAATELALMAASTAAAMAGLALAYIFYIARPELPNRLSSAAQAMYAILTNKYYVDEIYDAVIVWPIVDASREFLWKFVDVFIIDGAVNGTGRLVQGAAGGLKRMQTGYVRTYAGWILFGGILIVAWFLR